MDFDRITNTNKRTFNASLIREGHYIKLLEEFNRESFIFQD